MAVLATPPFLQFFDNSSPGIPLANGLIYTYAAGTTTPKATYTDYTEGVQAANPIVLDPQGRASLWISGSYKYIVKDALGNLIRTVDNVSSFITTATPAAAYFQTFSGDGATTVFTCSQGLGTDSKAIFVWIDAGGGKGYEIQNPSAYTISGTTLTFSGAPASGTNNIYVSAPATLVNAASASAAAAATSATASATSATLASQWASQTSGIVAATDFSAKAWSIGGTGVTTTSGKGAAKEWATSTGAAVDTSEYSAKEYAIGTTVAVGSAKLWATKTNGLVQSVDGSAKAWAIGGTTITSTSGAGAAKEWATTTGAFVDTADYSAKEWAIGTTANSAKTNADAAAVSATAAASSATTASGAAAAAAAAAASLANEWLFASSTTMADPTTGKFRLDNASFASVTNLAISASSGDAGNPNLHSFLLTWDDSTNSPRGVIRIEKNATNFIMLGVSGNITDNTTWVEVPVTVIASAGSFSASDVTFINFTQYGNNGTMTSSGSPTIGYLAKFTSATDVTKADLTGDVTTSGSTATTIGAGKVSNAMLAGSIDLTAKVTGALPIANGGTAAITAAAALTALGAASLITNTFTGAQIGTVTSLSSSSNSIAINLATNNNFSHTLTENTTLANPSNPTAGQSGCIAITQHASSAKTLAYGTQWIEATAGVAPTLSTTVGAQNILSYYVFDSTHIYYTLNKHGVA